LTLKALSARLPNWRNCRCVTQLRRILTIASTLSPTTPSNSSNFQIIHLAYALLSNSLHCLDNMIPAGSFGPWTPAHPSHNPLTVLTEGEKNVARSNTSKSKLKIRKTRVTDENKRPPLSSGSLAGFFRSSSSDSDGTNTGHGNSSITGKSVNIIPVNSLTVASVFLPDHRLSPLISQAANVHRLTMNCLQQP